MNANRQYISLHEIHHDKTLINYNATSDLSQLLQNMSLLSAPLTLAPFHMPQHQ